MGIQNPNKEIKWTSKWNMSRKLNFTLRVSQNGRKPLEILIWGYEEILGSLRSILFQSDYHLHRVLGLRVVERLFAVLHNSMIKEASDIGILLMKRILHHLGSLKLRSSSYEYEQRGLGCARCFPSTT